MFNDTADPSHVLVLQSCGCGTGLQRENLIRTWIMWLGLVDGVKPSHGWLVGSTGGLFTPERVFLWIAF